MKICILQPDYRPSAVDYQHYDPPRNLSALLPQDQVDHVFLNKLSTYRQLRELAREGYDIFVNLCEGYLDWDVPSVDVIHALDQLGLPYTGPSAHLYDPPKDLMKYVAYCAGIPVPAYVRITCPQDVSRALDQLTFPIFVKPAHAGDSLGIDEQSLVTDPPALRHRVDALLDTYGVLLAEQYIAGREFTVLVAAGPGEKEVRAFLPVEYRFPAGRSFKTYALKTSELHPDCNVPCRDPDLAG
ncbi:MAG TPA: hypothetical protein VG870_03950, partial [Chitinophagaceae bacterium]|nr:hypothetical protein [Chitinophagaceae bacterium]